MSPQLVLLFRFRRPPGSLGLHASFVALAAALLLGGCGFERGDETRRASAEPPPSMAAPPAERGATAERVFKRGMARIDAQAAAIDSLFQPLPLLTPAEEEALRRYRSPAQLARARALGVGRDLAPGQVEVLLRTGGLVALNDTAYWVVRDLDYSRPLVVPGVRTLLAEVGRRFHARLAEIGAPPYRLEVSSALRTAEDQAALREVNPNAASGTSAHEYGTTVDVLYSAFAAPAAEVVALDAAEAPWAEPYLRRYAEAQMERVAGRRAMELKAILGEVLLEMQREGLVMVTLERRQPVFHMTLAREP